MATKEDKEFLEYLKERDMYYQYKYGNKKKLTEITKDNIAWFIFGWMIGVAMMGILKGVL